MPSPWIRSEWHHSILKNRQWCTVRRVLAATKWHSVSIDIRPVTFTGVAGSIGRIVSGGSERMHCPNSRCHYQYQSHNDGNDLGRQFAEQMFIGQLAVNLVIRHILRCEARRNGAYFGNAGLLLFQARSDSSPGATARPLASNTGIRLVVSPAVASEIPPVTIGTVNRVLSPGPPIGAGFISLYQSPVLHRKDFRAPRRQKVEVKQTAGIRLRLVAVSSTGPIRQRNR